MMDNVRRFKFSVWHIIVVLRNVRVRGLILNISESVRWIVSTLLMVSFVKFRTYCVCKYFEFGYGNGIEREILIGTQCVALFFFFVCMHRASLQILHHSRDGSCSMDYDSFHSPRSCADDLLMDSSGQQFCVAFVRTQKTALCGCRVNGPEISPDALQHSIEYRRHHTRHNPPPSTNRVVNTRIKSFYNPPIDWWHGRHTAPNLRSDRVCTRTVRN